MPIDPHAEETLFHPVTELNHRRVDYVHLLYQLMPSGNMQDSKANETHLADALMRKVRKAFSWSPDLVWWIHQERGPGRVENWVGRSDCLWQTIYTESGFSFARLDCSVRQTLNPVSEGCTEALS